MQYCTFRLEMSVSVTFVLYKKAFIYRQSRRSRHNLPHHHWSHNTPRYILRSS